MKIERMEHVGVVVEDLDAAKAFFVALGLEVQGEATVEGAWVGRVIGLTDVRSDIVMLETPGGDGRLELTRFHAPAAVDGDPAGPSNATGLRHVTFRVDDVDLALDRVRPHGAELVGTVERYGETIRLCYVRGPEGIIVELAESKG
ncbi:VOC family protein [Patulibacter minatonensis]|uniref:VOC family protein n=1 Tax=Patulibacter minatonensis TaxID=298163 RepID=UPI00047D8940|nr:VOC family protein [Patulibacter minatonensis]